MTIDGLTRGGPERYMLWAAVLGAADLAIARLVPTGAVASGLALLVSLGVLAVAALAGVAAVRRAQRPGWAGALPGLAYGIVSGLDDFFQHETLGQARTALRLEGARAVKLTPQAFMQAANAPVTHLLQFLTGALFLTLFGIIVGSLAGLFMKRYLPALAPRGR